MSNTQNAIARNAVKKVASTEMLTEEFHRLMAASLSALS